MTGENEYSPLMTRISRRGGVPPPLPSKNFLQNFSPSAKFPQFFFAFGEMFRMLNDRSNSEKSLNDQDLQEGGSTPPPYPIRSRIFLMTNMRCIFEIIKFIRPMPKHENYQRSSSTWKSEILLISADVMTKRQKPERKCAFGATRTSPGSFLAVCTLPRDCRIDFGKTMSLALNK